MWIYIRSILYCLGRSNASYFNPQIRHLGIRKEHFSWWVYWTYYYHWWFMTYLLTALYFCRHDSWAWLKDGAHETTRLYTYPLQVSVEVLLLWWELIYILGKKIHKSINFVKWTSDWTIMSWFQFNLYRYFTRIRFYFYLKVYWYEPVWFILTFIRTIDEELLQDPDNGPGAKRRAAEHSLWLSRVGTAKNKGLPAPQPDRSHIKSAVIVNKQVFYTNRRDYYFNYRAKSKPLSFGNNSFKSKSKWI